MHARATAFLKKKERKEREKECVHVCVCLYTYSHTRTCIVFHAICVMNAIRKFAYKHINFHVASRFLDLLSLAIYRNQRSKNIVILVPNRKAFIVIYYIVYTQLLAERSN